MAILTDIRHIKRVMQSKAKSSRRSDISEGPHARQREAEHAAQQTFQESENKELV